MARDKNNVESSLRSKGFGQSEGDHHRFYYVRSDGLVTAIRTKTSHTKKMKTIGDPLISQMAKQCKVTKQDFLNLIDCPLSRTDYEAKLVTAGIIEKAPTK